MCDLFGITPEYNKHISPLAGQRNFPKTAVETVVRLTYLQLTNAIANTQINRQREELGMRKVFSTFRRMASVHVLENRYDHLEYAEFT